MKALRKMLKRTNKNKKGYMLMELALTVAIVAVLASFAVPHFVDLQKQTRISAMKDFAKKVYDMSSLVRNTYLIKSATGDYTSNPDGTANIELDDGTQIKVYANGFPVAADLGQSQMANAFRILPDYIITGVVDNSTAQCTYFAYKNPGIDEFHVQESHCVVKYCADPTTHNITVDVDTSGC